VLEPGQRAKTLYCPAMLMLGVQNLPSGLTRGSPGSAARLQETESDPYYLIIFLTPNCFFISLRLSLILSEGALSLRPAVSLL
jgi:hypothetical protein